MSRLPLVVLILALACVPTAARAQAPAPDVVVTLDASAQPQVEGDAELVSQAADNVSVRLRLTKPWTIVEVRHDGHFDVERVAQIVPHLWVPHEDYPLFTVVSRPVWDVDGVPRYGLYNVSQPGPAAVFQLGLPGPREGGPAEPFEALLSLVRDLEPPEITPGGIRDPVWYGFYQEARTSELALMDLVVCCDPQGAEIRNPTTTYHVLHRFPIQGLDAQKTYQLRLEARDWAGNAAQAQPYEFTTPARPIVPKPSVTALTPLPNATVEAGVVAITARIETPDSPLADNGIRFFLDKKPVTENLFFENGTFRYVAQLERGVHSANVEATNAEGGMGHASWSFRVGKGGVPAAGLAPLAAALAGVALALRRVRD